MSNLPISSGRPFNLSPDKKFQILFCRMLENKYYRVKVLLKMFHLNGQAAGFRPQTWNSESSVKEFVRDITELFEFELVL